MVSSYDKCNQNFCSILPPPLTWVNKVKCQFSREESGAVCYDILSNLVAV
jgi:hypothetical protein